MLRTFYTLCFIILVSANLFAQKTIKDYKYIIIPKQYEFQKTEDQYQLNSLTKFLFDKEGFVTYFSDETYPEDLALNACSALKAIVKNNSGLLTTKVIINLTDCYNNKIYSSPEGKSKIKDYKRGYQDAIRKAFAGFQEYLNDTTNVENVKPVVVATPIKEVASEPLVAEKERVAETNNNVVVQEKVVKKSAPAVVTAPVVVTTSKKEAKEIKQAKPVKASKVYTIEGTYFIDMWGECVISKKGNDYKVVGGDEDFEFAEIYTTSKPSIFMVKKTGFKQTQLLELDENGNLKIDSKSGVKVYKRIN